MLDSIVEYIDVLFGMQVFEQSVGILMGTKCVSLVAGLFLYSYETKFVYKLSQDKNKNFVVSFNYT
jgi:uncharacterized protein Veg